MAAFGSGLCLIPLMLLLQISHALLRLAWCAFMSTYGILDILVLLSSGLIIIIILIIINARSCKSSS